MSNPLFDTVLPEKLAKRGQRIDFKSKISDFERLVEIIATDLAGIAAASRPRNWQAGQVEIRLEFARVGSGKGIPAVNGRVLARVPAICQRCLEAFDLALDAPLRLLLLEADEETGEIPDFAGYEVWEMESDNIRPIDIVEESLVMAMPLAPVHATMKDCGARFEINEEDEAEQVRPFADLKSQMERSNT